MLLLLSVFTADKRPRRLLCLGSLRLCGHVIRVRSRSSTPSLSGLSS